MFTTLEDFANNQKKFMISSDYWTFSNNDISRFKTGLIHHLNNADWSKTYHNFNHLLKLGLLENEILFTFYEGWSGFTNYRFYYNSNSGLFSIPISSIIKYWSYKTSNLSEIESAKRNLKAKGLNFKDHQIIYKTLDGDFEVFEGDDVPHEDPLKRLIKNGEYLILTEEATKSIYQSRVTLKKKYPELKRWNMESFIKNLGDEGESVQLNFEAIPNKSNGAKKEKSLIRILAILGVISTFLPWYNGLFGEEMGFKYIFIPIILLPLIYSYVSDENRRNNPLYGFFLGYGPCLLFLFIVFSLMVVSSNSTLEYERALAREGLYGEIEIGMGIGLILELILCSVSTYFVFRLDGKD